MKRPWSFDQPTWRCRIGLHRWAPLGISARRCLRPHCVAIKPGLWLGPVAGDAVRIEPPATPGVDYWVTVTRWDGLILYEGPIPVPVGLDRMTRRDVELGRWNRYEYIALELDEGS